MPRSLIHGRRSKSIDFPAGITLFDSDRPPHRIYLLRSGRIYLANSRGAIVDYLVPGSFFGEKCWLSSRYRDQIATSRSQIQAQAFRKSELLDLIQHDRRFALRLLKSLALRLDRCEQSLTDFVVERIEGRLARLLARLAPAKPRSGWVRLQFSPSNFGTGQDHRHHTMAGLSLHAPLSAVGLAATAAQPVGQTRRSARVSGIFRQTTLAARGRQRSRVRLRCLASWPLKQNDYRCVAGALGCEERTESAASTTTAATNARTRDDRGADWSRLK